MDVQKIYEYLGNLYSFDLHKGPFIYGSSTVYHHLSSLGEKPSWLPREVDILCRNQNQFDELDVILTSLSTNIKIFDSPEHLRGNQYSKDFDIPDCYKVQIFVFDMNHEQVLSNIDYTILRSCFDGKNWSIAPGTIDDIKNKRLIENNNSVEKRVRTKGYTSIKYRYLKYISRGFVDTDNLILNKIESYKNNP